MEVGRSNGSISGEAFHFLTAGFSVLSHRSCFVPTHLLGEPIFMLAPSLLLIIGILTGLITRIIVGGKAYGAVADAVDWFLSGPTYTSTSWSNSLLFEIWGAAALPMFAHFLARRQVVQRQHGIVSGA
jgi:hypothetical protein